MVKFVTAVAPSRRRQRRDIEDMIIPRATKTVLGVVLVAAWACATASAAALDPAKDDVIRVSCTPVEIEGEVFCRGSPRQLENKKGFYSADPGTIEPVECRVDLYTGGEGMLPNECQELSDRPGFSSCSSTIPRGLQLIAYCKMVGYTYHVPFFDGFFLPAEKSQCQRDCEKVTAEGACSVDEKCLQCLEDFRAFFPDVKMERNLCGRDPAAV